MIQVVAVTFFFFFFCSKDAHISCCHQIDRRGRYFLSLSLLGFDKNCQCAVDDFGCALIKKSTLTRHLHARQMCRTMPVYRGGPALRYVVACCGGLLEGARAASAVDLNSTLLLESCVCVCVDLISTYHTHYRTTRKCTPQWSSLEIGIRIDGIWVEIIS